MLLGYLDVFTDIYAVMLYFSRKQYYFVSLSVLFIALPTAIAVLLQKGWGTRLVALCQCALLREVVYSIYRNQEETAMLGTLKLLESVVEACPSSLLQLYILLLAWMQRSTAHTSSVSARTDTVEDRSSGLVPTFSDQVILFSVGVSVVSTAWTLSYACRSERERRWVGDNTICTLAASCVWLEQHTDISTLQLCVCVYNLAEVIFRLLSMASLFLVVGGYGLVFLAGSFLIRGYLAYVFGEFDDLPQSLAKNRRQAVLGGDDESRERSNSFASSVVSAVVSSLSLFAVVKVLCCCMFSLVTDTVWLQNRKLILILHVQTGLEGVICFFFLLVVPSEQLGIDTYDAKALSIVYVAAVAWCVKLALAIWRWVLLFSMSDDTATDDDELDGDSIRNSDIDQSDADSRCDFSSSRITTCTDDGQATTLPFDIECNDANKELWQIFDDV